jgi:hypothetical protein
MSSPSQETPHTVWTPKIDYYSDKSLTLASVLSQINTVHALLFCLFKIHFTIILPWMPRSSTWSLAFTVSNYNSVFLFSLMCATCPVYPILLDLITLIIFGKDINHKSPHRKFSLASRYFLLCRSKYLPQHSVLAYLQYMFFP